MQQSSSCELPQKDLRPPGKVVDCNGANGAADSSLFFDEPPEAEQLQKANEALAPFFSENARPRVSPYPADQPKSQGFIRVMREYCQAVCRSLTAGSSTTSDEFTPLMGMCVPRFVCERTDKHEVALLKLTKQL